MKDVSMKEIILLQHDLVSRLKKENEQMYNLLLWSLYHHQGPNSVVGQPIRAFLKIGQFEHLTAKQIAAGRATAESLVRDPEGVVKA